jgi:hypothetical protein
LRDIQDFGRAVRRAGQHDRAENFDVSQAHLFPPQ